MPSTAFVFPGQGSQSIGMLAGLAAIDPVVRDTFGEASEVLGYDLWQTVSEGPAEKLNATECTQPAMLTAGIATWRLWQKLGGAAPDLVLGHSLGEFTALVAAGALEFRTGVALVRERAQRMQAAVPAGVGAMAAILGVDDADVVAACEQAAGTEVVQAVNFNSPGQVVIAGHASAVARAIDVLKQKGAKRAVLLPISVPAHSSLMEAAGRELRPSIDAAALRRPAIAFWSPADALPHEEPVDLADLLQRQLAQPVRWSETVRAITAAGDWRVAECGPGEVLTGLCRRIVKGRTDVECIALADEASIRSALEKTGRAT